MPLTLNADAPRHRSQLLLLLQRIDELETQAGEILAAPVYPDVGELAEELRELLVGMRAKVEQHLGD